MSAPPPLVQIQVGVVSVVGVAVAAAVNEGLVGAVRSTTMSMRPDGEESDRRPVAGRVPLLHVQGVGGPAARAPSGV